MGSQRLHARMPSPEDIVLFSIFLISAATMYVRVELDFKRNIFRVLGHSIASVLVVLALGFSINIIDRAIALDWFLLSIMYLFINEIIRIYLRKHQMKDILQNHPRLYWLTRGKYIRKKQDTKD